MENFWSVKIDEIYTSLSSSPKGLNNKEAATNLKKYGKNILQKRNHLSTFFLFIQQFKSPITLILIFAATLSGILGDITDMLINITIILYNT